MKTNESRWRAVTRKDRGADGKFVFSVGTTGVYCRPSCPSRPARRENVSFHATAADAERAGFRACKRCRPGGPSPAQEHAALVAQACRAIEQAVEAPALGALAREAGLSAHHFHRVFKAATGLTPKAYASACRARRLRAALPKAGSVTEAIYEAGFGSSGRFYENASQALGMAPSRYKNGGSGAVVRYAAARCSLGAVLVAASDRGICSVSLGEDAAALAAELRRRFPNAALAAGDKAFARQVERVVALVETPAAGLDLPLDIRGSAFQQRVWRELRGIPAGKTASYAEIARRLGAPKSARAVARACAANTLAVAIPCHRVVRGDGALSGYRWGLARKRALLKREAGR